MVPFERETERFEKGNTNLVFSTDLIGGENFMGNQLEDKFILIGCPFTTSHKNYTYLFVF